MSSLTSQQINNSYQGLIKLEDSTSGVTSNLQILQDGVGNDIPVKVSATRITSSNLFSTQDWVPDFGGTGFASLALQYAAGTQNLLNSTPFYDRGLHSYSAITFRVATASTTSDSAELAFYSAQWVDGQGLQPYQLIMSGINFSTGDLSSTGLKTVALPSTLSFSADGSNIYFVVLKISNSGVQPTVRTGNNNQTAGYFNPFLVLTTGMCLSPDGQELTAFVPTTGNAGTLGQYYTTLSTFKTQFDAADFPSGEVSNTSYNGLGFGLNVIK
jgi:hypothetical protein